MLAWHQDVGVPISCLSEYSNVPNFAGDRNHSVKMSVTKIK